MALLPWPRSLERLLRSGAPEARVTTTGALPRVRARSEDRRAGADANAARAGHAVVAAADILTLRKLRIRCQRGEKVQSGGSRRRGSAGLLRRPTAPRDAERLARSQSLSTGRSRRPWLRSRRARCLRVRECYAARAKLELGQPRQPRNLRPLRQTSAMKDESACKSSRSESGGDSGVRANPRFSTKALEIPMNESGSPVEFHRSPVSARSAE